MFSFLYNLFVGSNDVNHDFNHNYHNQETRCVKSKHFSHFEIRNYICDNCAQLNVRYL